MSKTFCTSLYNKYIVYFYLTVLLRCLCRPFTKVNNRTADENKRKSAGCGPETPRGRWGRAFPLVALRFLSDTQRTGDGADLSTPQSGHAHQPPLKNCTDRKRKVTQHILHHRHNIYNGFWSVCAKHEITFIQLTLCSKWQWVTYF